MKAWLAKNTRITLHFTPTSGSWLNMVEIFFGIITRQAIRRGTFTSVKDLIAAIETSSTAGTNAAQPFVWTKTADQIIPRATEVNELQTARHYYLSTRTSTRTVGSSLSTITVAGDLSSSYQDTGTSESYCRSTIGIPHTYIRILRQQMRAL